MQKNAFAVLRLTPEQFWNLTLREYNLMMEGYVELRKVDEELEYRRTAQLASWIINVWTKKKITPEMLLGPNSSPKVQQQPATSEDVQDLALELGAGLKIRQKP